MMADAIDGSTSCAPIEISRADMDIGTLQDHYDDIRTPPSVALRRGKALPQGGFQRGALLVDQA
jgi:hypothetical protein